MLYRTLDGKIDFNEHENSRERYEEINSILNQEFSKGDIRKLRKMYQNEKPEMEFEEWKNSFVRVPSLKNAFIDRSELETEKNRYQQEIYNEINFVHDRTQKDWREIPSKEEMINDYFYERNRTIESKEKENDKLKEDHEKELEQLQEKYSERVNGFDEYIENLKAQQKEGQEFGLGDKYEEMIVEVSQNRDIYLKEFNADLAEIQRKLAEDAKKENSLLEEKQQLEKEKKEVLLDREVFESSKEQVMKTCKENGLELKDFYDSNTGIEKVFFITPDYRQIGLVFDPANSSKHFYQLDPEKSACEIENIKDMSTDELSRTLLNLDKDFNKVEQFVDEGIKSEDLEYVKSIKLDDIINKSKKEVEEKTPFEQEKRSLKNYYSEREHEEKVYEVVCTQNFFERVKTSLSKEGRKEIWNNLKYDVNKVWDGGIKKLNNTREAVADWWNNLDKKQVAKTAAVTMAAGATLFALMGRPQDTKAQFYADAYENLKVVEVDCGNGYKAYAKTLDAAKAACSLNNTKEASETKIAATLSVVSDEEKTLVEGNERNNQEFLIQKAGERGTQEEVSPDIIVETNALENEGKENMEQMIEIIENDEDQQRDFEVDEKTREYISFDEEKIKNESISKNNEVEIEISHESENVITEETEKTETTSENKEITNDKTENQEESKTYEQKIQEEQEKIKDIEENIEKESHDKSALEDMRLK